MVLERPNRHTLGKRQRPSSPFLYCDSHVTCIWMWPSSAYIGTRVESDIVLPPPPPRVASCFFLLGKKMYIHLFLYLRIDNIVDIYIYIYICVYKLLKLPTPTFTGSPCFSSLHLTTKMGERDPLPIVMYEHQVANSAMRRHIQPRTPHISDIQTPIVCIGCVI